MLQKERKSGHWQVERLQFLKREQRGLRLRYAVIDLQPCDLQTAKIFCLLQHKGARIFQIKRLDEATIGALMMHFILETLITAKLWRINPFGQPAVEAGKKLAKTRLAEKSEYAA